VNVAISYHRLQLETPGVPSKRISDQFLAVLVHYLSSKDFSAVVARCAIFFSFLRKERVLFGISSVIKTYGTGKRVVSDMAASSCDQIAYQAVSPQRVERRGRGFMSIGVGRQPCCLTHRLPDSRLVGRSERVGAECAWKPHPYFNLLSILSSIQCSSHTRGVYLHAVDLHAEMHVNAARQAVEPQCPWSALS